MTKRKTLYLGLAMFSLFSITLLVTGRGLLVWESIPEEEKTIYCSYFSGRNFQTKEFWYSSNDMLGKSMCPFLYSYE